MVVGSEWIGMRGGFYQRRLKQKQGNTGEMKLGFGDDDDDDEWKKKG